MGLQHVKPGDIETTSMRTIRKELEEKGFTLPEKEAERAVLLRAIHTSADFDYAENLRFVENGPEAGVRYFLRGIQADSEIPETEAEEKIVITDTNMALSGISKRALCRLSGRAVCYMADPEIARIAKEEGSTRARASMEYAGKLHPHAVFASGNAPTALISLTEQIEKGLRPSLVVGVPVGFVNVVESKEMLLDACEHHHIPAVIAMGRKGGSNVAAAIINAMLYTAAGWLNPENRK
ncbi:MAG: precorrin-8X methylmutase [Eubacterium sp.]|nr:precorrin-8X methylmutase [Eubacterium sp.]MCH4046279.1 precorrin-8X methylmutase [Eubacterium sp.]MCH4079374.1 precorrin-8X methylmutase [Eubacterium sp.]MCI1307475.1 precorrin-8X methylmutase [Eubacterium sp.]MCI1405993.1 precorrin-8X methylmutase [Eubacterium sp.]